MRSFHLALVGREEAVLYVDFLGPEADEPGRWQVPIIMELLSANGRGRKSYYYWHLPSGAVTLVATHLARPLARADHKAEGG